MDEENKKGDWRDNYICCSHILSLSKEEAASANARHRGFRVCCEKCYPGFLYSEMENG